MPNRPAVLKATGVAGFVAILWSAALPGFHFLGKDSQILPPGWALLQAGLALVGLLAIFRGRRASAVAALISLGFVLVVTLVEAALLAGSRSFWMVSPPGWIATYAGAALLLLTRPLHTVLHP